ncbi:MAG: cytochrome c [Anaerolineae bacterium]|nr:cytochrome c [Anaerolineae bacterium]
MKSRFTPILFILTLLLAACGSVATPEWAAEVQGTQVALAETAAYETSIAPTATPTDTPTVTPLPPTETPIPPTATTEPPTNTPEPPTATFTPSPIPQDTSAGGGDDQAAIDAALAAGDPAHGDELFHTLRSEVGFACATCHNVDNPNRLIGPSLMNIKEHAGSRVEGEGPVEYIHNSILHPNDFIVPPDEGGPYPENLMPQVYGDLWTEQELNDIIAYLLTL